VNISIGAPYTKCLNHAVDSVHDKGISVIVAAKNRNADACDFSPSSATKAITVGSTDRYDYRSWFSNWGSE